MSNDFFDEDLVSDGMAAARQPLSGESEYDRRKRVLPNEIAETSDELERLHQKQDDLERRKREIIEQRRQIELFEHNRKDLIDKLRRNAVLVVRQGSQASRVAALCSEVGSSFSKLHAEIEAMDPQKWNEDEFDARFSEAQAKLESARVEYGKAMDGVSAVGWHTASSSSPVSSGAVDSVKRGFSYWLVAGLGFTLPLIIVIAALVFLAFGLGHGFF